MKLARAIVLLAVITSVVSMTRAAVADDVFRPDSLRIVQDDWTFIPVVQISDTGSVDVVGTLGLRDPSQVSGDNLVAVWYSNPHADETWPAISWKSQAQWDAITWVKDTYAIGDEWDFLWPTTDDNPYEPAAEAPKNYESGLLEGDPFAELIGQYSHTEVVSILVDAGYAAASIPVDEEGPCDTKSLFPALVDVTIAHVLFDITETEAQNALVTMVSSACAQVMVAKWKPTAPPGLIQRPAPPGNPNPAPWTPPGAPGPIAPMYPLVPGWWSPYVCVQITTGCTCTSYGRGTIPSGTLIPMRITCTAANCPSPAGTPPANASPAPPPMMCVTEYFW